MLLTPFCTQTYRKAENHAIDSPRKVSEPAKGPDLLYIHLLSGSIIAPQRCQPARSALLHKHVGLDRASGFDQAGRSFRVKRGTALPKFREAEEE